MTQRRAFTLVGLTVVAFCAAQVIGQDTDGDGVPDSTDCAPLDGAIWAVPAEDVDDLRLTRGGSTAVLEWSPPADVGGLPGSERYDTLAGSDAACFCYPSGFCPELNGADTVATDDRPFLFAPIHHYLVRVENDCGSAPLDGGGTPAQPRTTRFLEVTTLADSGPGSLREAIDLADAGDAVCLGVSGTITLTSDGLLVDKDIAIAGLGPDEITLTSTPQFRPVTLDADASLSGAALEGDSSNSGSGVKVEPGRTPTIAWTRITDFGVGVSVDSASPVITTTTIAGNVVGVGSVFGAPRIKRSTITGNTDAGVYSYSSNTTLVNTTVSENLYGIYAGYYPEDIVIRSSTIAGNTHGIYVYARYYQTPTSVTLDNTILSNTSNCEAVDEFIVSEGHNLSSDSTCVSLTQPGDKQNVDPLLEPLGDNGGPTATHALAVGSPAIDTGSCPALTADQRGAPRPVDDPAAANAKDGCDIGAYEAQADFECDCQSTADCDFPDTCFAGCICRYEPFCGSGICDPGEDGVSCPEDCPAVCGNGLVEPGEECEVFQDCGLCPIGQVPVCTDCECDCVPL